MSITNVEFFSKSLVIINFGSVEYSDRVFSPFQAYLESCLSLSIDSTLSYSVYMTGYLFQFLLDLSLFLLIMVGNSFFFPIQKFRQFFCYPWLIVWETFHVFCWHNRLYTEINIFCYNAYISF